MARLPAEVAECSQLSAAVAAPEALAVAAAVAAAAALATLALPPAGLGFAADCSVEELGIAGSECSRPLRSAASSGRPYRSRSSLTAVQFKHKSRAVNGFEPKLSKAC